MNKVEVPSTKEFVYLGIDPGNSGGMTAITTSTNNNCHAGVRVNTIPMPDTESDVWYWLNNFSTLTNKTPPSNTYESHYPSDAHSSAPYNTSESHLDISTRTPNIKALIEAQYPRPTVWRPSDNSTVMSSILRSTCILYGSYMSLRAFLIAAQIPFDEVDPKKWQKFFGLAKKDGEGKTDWKNRLKAKAQQLFPTVKVTLSTADALLIACYNWQLEKVDK